MQFRCMTSAYSVFTECLANFHKMYISTLQKSAISAVLLSSTVSALPIKPTDTNTGHLLITIIILSTVLVVLAMYVVIDICQRLSYRKPQKKSSKTKTIEKSAANFVIQDNQPSCTVDVLPDTSKDVDMLRFVLRNPKIELPQIIQAGRIDLVRTIFEETRPSLQEFQNYLHEACVNNQEAIVTLIAGYLEVDDMALDIELDLSIRSAVSLPELQLNESMKMIEHLAKTILRQKRVSNTSPLNRGILSWSIKNSELKIINHLELLALNLDSVDEENHTPIMSCFHRKYKPTEAKKLLIHFWEQTLKHSTTTDVNEVLSAIASWTPQHERKELVQKINDIERRRCLSMHNNKSS